PFEGNPVATSVEQVAGEIPTTISLSDNYPNPFNPTTTFEYTVSDLMDVRVRVYDVTGRLISTLVDGTQPAATYRVSFDAAGLSSGTYFYTIEAGTQAITKKMVLLK
ncbi:MAG: T9SS type A sorting domain-containing protein, partial [Bacteroidota bacterium]